MEYFALIGTVLLVHFLAVIIPGPDFIMVAGFSLQYSRRTGIFLGLGLSAGIFVHIFYCIMGLAVVISQSILLFTIIKILGALYLGYIGLKSMFSKSLDIKIQSIEQKEDISPYEAVKIGFVAKFFNPNTTLFFLGLFSMVLSPDTPFFIIALLSIMMFIDQFLWMSLVSLFFTQKRILKVFNRFQGISNTIFGGILIALGIKIACSIR